MLKRKKISQRTLSLSQILPQKGQRFPSVANKKEGLLLDISSEVASLGRGIFFKHILHTSKISEGGINKVMLLLKNTRYISPNLGLYVFNIVLVL